MIAKDKHIIISKTLNVSYNLMAVMKSTLLVA